MIIGITGGIGSGKTTVTNLLQQNINIIDADVIAHQVLQKGTPAFHEVISTFGQSFLLANGELNRVELRKTVFCHPEALQKLNAITHPRIRQMLTTTITQSRQKNYQVLSAPLLIENKLLDLVDAVVVVDVDEKTQLERALKRDGRDIKTMQQIMKNQVSRNERLRLANFVIDNNGTPTQTAQQTLLLHQHLITLIEENS